MESVDIVMSVFVFVLIVFFTVYAYLKKREIEALKKQNG